MDDKEKCYHIENTDYCTFIRIPKAVVQQRTIMEILSMASVFGYPEVNQTFLKWTFSTDFQIHYHCAYVLQLFGYERLGDKEAIEKGLVK